MSDSRIEKYVLNDIEYELGVIPPSSALPVMVKLGNIIGSGGESLQLGDLTKLKDAKGLDGDNVLNAIAGVLKLLNPDDTMYIVNQCLPYIWVTVGGQRQRCIMDQHFIGRNLDLLKVIGQFLKHNFKDFFSGSL